MAQEPIVEGQNERVRAIVQRVTEASVDIGNNQTAKIGAGLVLLVGIHRDDKDGDAKKLADRIAGTRIFSDSEGKMNLSIKQAHSPAEILVVSNFTVYGDAMTSRRPGFKASAPYELGETLFAKFVEELGRFDIEVKTGIFGADMRISLVNDGPVTLVLDTLE